MVGFMQVIGGLALFLFGIRMLSTGMEKLAGQQIQRWLERLTNNPIKGALFGMTATALLHSSSTMMITLMGLINANLMTLEQSVGVMLGTEIGTTVTAQIIAFDIGNFNLLFIAVGLIMLDFMSVSWRKYGEIVMGFGLLFLGMDVMSGALRTLAEIPVVADSLMAFGEYPLAAVLVGTLVTAVVQSSTAVTSLAVAMGMSSTITLPGAIGLILGANIGTCIDTQLVAALRLSRAAFRASLTQVLINMSGVLLLLPLIGVFADLIALTSSSLPRQIANAHTIFNVSVSLLLLPFTGHIGRLMWRLVPRSSAEEQPKLTAFIDEMQYKMPPLALTEAARELNRLGLATAEMVEWGGRALVHQEMEYARRVLSREDELIDPLYKEIECFINTLMLENLDDKQQRRCFQLKNLLIDIERVGDTAENIAQLACERVQKNVTFSVGATNDLDRLCGHVHHTYLLGLEALERADRDEAKHVCGLEEEFDLMYWQARESHIQRVNEGVCHPEAAVIYMEVLRHFERISDHADNLGVSVMRAH